MKVKNFAIIGYGDLAHHIFTLVNEDEEFNFLGFIGEKNWGNLFLIFDIFLISFQGVFGLSFQCHYINFDI